jgi:hypothetical protein
LVDVLVVVFAFVFAVVFVLGVVAISHLPWFS